MDHAFSIGEQVVEVWLSRLGDGYELNSSGNRFKVSLKKNGSAEQVLHIGSQEIPFVAVSRGDEIHIHLMGESHTLHYESSLDRFAAEALGNSEAISRAPMPGSVISLPVSVGQAVSMGDLLIVIESMKMETAIRASMDGVVEALHVQLGQTFERDSMLVTLAPSQAEK